MVGKCPVEKVETLPYFSIKLATETKRKVFRLSPRLSLAHFFGASAIMNGVKTLGIFLLLRAPKIFDIISSSLSWSSRQQEEKWGKRRNVTWKVLIVFHLWRNCGFRYFHIITKIQLILPRNKCESLEKTKQKQLIFLHQHALRWAAKKLCHTFISLGFFLLKAVKNLSSFQARAFNSLWYFIWSFYDFLLTKPKIKPSKI